MEDQTKAGKTSPAGMQGGTDWRGKATGSLEKDLEKAESLSSFLRENQEEMIEPEIVRQLNDLLKAKKIKKAVLARKAGMSDIYLFQILAGKRAPSRNRLLSLCLGLGLSPDETQTLLKRGGYAVLYVRNPRDAVILYALENHWDIYKLNETLFEAGLEEIL